MYLDILCESVEKHAAFVLKNNGRRKIGREEKEMKIIKLVE